MLTADLLKQVFPLCADPGRWAQALNPAFERYEINTHPRLCSFLAQTGHESAQFNRLVESLNYTAALAAAWFWNSHGLNALADDRTDDNDLEDFTEITRRINGGTVGIQERLLAFNAVEAHLA
jgi:putative chitinase